MDDRSRHLSAFGISLKRVYMHFIYLDIKSALLKLFSSLLPARSSKAG